MRRACHLFLLHLFLRRLLFLRGKLRRASVGGPVRFVRLDSAIL